MQLRWMELPRNYATDPTGVRASNMDDSIVLDTRLPGNTINCWVRSLCREQIRLRMDISNVDLLTHFFLPTEHNLLGSLSSWTSCHLIYRNFISIIPASHSNTCSSESGVTLTQIMSTSSRWERMKEAGCILHLLPERILATQSSSDEGTYETNYQYFQNFWNVGHNEEPHQPFSS